MSEGRFTGRVAVVTGASRGIGFGIAERLATEGAAVVLNARRADELDAGVESLRDRGLRVAGVAGSVDDAEVAAQVVATAVERFGRLDHIVNNVGVNAAYGGLARIDRAAFVKTMTTNTWPLIALVQAGLAHGLADGGGSVVAVSTCGVRNASTTVAPYVASKAALNSLCRSLARELGPLGVRVNVVAPGLVKTKLSRVLWEGERGGRHASVLPLGRLGEAGDLGAAAAFLLSDDAAWITGTVLDVDGGFMLVGGDPEVLDL
jgi:3-oxoacyl-[acyl-carrier protein] reductase